MLEERCCLFFFWITFNWWINTWSLKKSFVIDTPLNFQAMCYESFDCIVNNLFCWDSYTVTPTLILEMISILMLWYVADPYIFRDQCSFIQLCSFLFCCHLVYGNIELISFFLWLCWLLRFWRLCGFMNLYEFF